MGNQGNEHAHHRWRDIDYQPKSGELAPEALLDLCQPGATVLEVGCGRGSLALAMAERGARVTGIDINAEAIAEAERRARDARHGNVSFVVGDYASDMGSSRDYDIVAAVRFLTCLPEPTVWIAAVERLRSAVRVGGVLYIWDFAVFPEGYGRRYEEGLSLGWGYGVFCAPAGGVSFVAKHHTDAEIDNIGAGLVVERRVLHPGRSMNGNACMFFELLARNSDVGETE